MFEKLLKKHLPLIILAFIVILGFVIRFYMLGDAPAGLYVDEAAQGYSAYSIFMTGKDEFGKAFPVVFRSFADFKTPIYTYFIVPLIALFGLTKFTVRFPSAFFSLLTLPTLYFLVKEITPQKSKSTAIALLSSFLLAISPWHTLFGRTAFECNIALFFMILGSLLFFKSLKKPKLILFSAVSFAVSIVAYHAQRMVVPLLLIAFLVRYKKTLLKKTHKKYFIFSLLLGFVILLPTLVVSFTPGFLSRASTLNIFNYARQSPHGYMSEYTGVLSAIINNRVFLSVREFVSLYMSYFSPRNMFWLSDADPRTSYPQLATFYIWQLPFYLYGLYILIKKQKLKDLRFFTLSLLLISPLPAAITRDSYTTIRSLQMVVPLMIIISIAIVTLYQKLGKLWKKISIVGFCLIIIFSLLKLYSSAILLNEYHRAQYWNYGWQQVVQSLQEELDPQLPVSVDNARGEPYIQLLFFTRHDPKQFQQQNLEVSLDEYYTNMTRERQKKIGRISTHPLNWKYDLAYDQYLVGDVLSMSPEQIKEHDVEIVKKIYYPDGRLAFIIVRTNP